MTGRWISLLIAELGMVPWSSPPLSREDVCGDPAGYVFRGAQKYHQLDRNHSAQPFREQLRDLFFWVFVAAVMVNSGVLSFSWMIRGETSRSSWRNNGSWTACLMCSHLLSRELGLWDIDLLVTLDSITWSTGEYEAWIPAIQQREECMGVPLRWKVSCHFMSNGTLYRAILTIHSSLSGLWKEHTAMIEYVLWVRCFMLFGNALQWNSRRWFCYCSHRSTPWYFIQCYTRNSYYPPALSTLSTYSTMLLCL